MLAGRHRWSAQSKTAPFRSKQQSTKPDVVGADEADGCHAGPANYSRPSLRAPPPDQAPPAIMSTRAIALFSGCLILCLAAGCATGKGPFGDRTAVLVENRTPAKIIEASIAVFQEKQFQLRSSGRAEAVLEIKSSAWMTVTWGGWDAGGVWERAHLKVTDYGGGSYLLEVDVELIGDKGDEFFEDSRPLPQRRYEPYQELLNEIQFRLRQTPA
jgi:hypothetical protein